MSSRLMTAAMRLFFRLLYHPFSWAYDLVASSVSLGRWKRWVLAAVPLLHGPRILELGFGPGHLQVHLHEQGIEIFGLDESMQMTQQAQRRLRSQGAAPRLARGLAQHLPYPDASFQSVAATFPTQYIVDPLTLAEIMRVLVPGGRLVVLMSTWITGKRARDRALQKIYQATAQVPPEGQELSEFVTPYDQAGFQTSLRFTELPEARLMFIIAQKPRSAPPDKIKQ
jgi:ubiquinone/menaquinone biosynthesis C-methylase UbiE